MKEKLYTSFFYADFPLFFIKIDENKIIKEKNSLKIKCKSSAGGQQDDDYCQLRRLATLKNKSIFILLFLPIIVFLIITSIILISLFRYEDFANEQLFILFLLIDFLWSAYYSLEPLRDSRKTDFIVSLLVGIPSIALFIYSVVNSDSQLMISSLLFLVLTIIYLESIKPILILLKKKTTEYYEFGEKIKFLLIKG